jgi:acetylornithine deacetylase/succinyl-diaminopimelate desuccinylase-like protein
MSGLTRNSIEENMGRFVDELIDWLKIPSISTLPEHDADTRRAAEWAATRLRGIGFPLVELVEGDGHPLVYAEWMGHSSQPVVLIYGHYDVQPVDPLAEWHSSPFEPRIEGGAVYARGASDDKGQVMVVLAALQSLVEQRGGLPVNVKILLEGEEEAGGCFVEKYVRSEPARLAADAALICDTHMNSLDEPSIINGLRGILYTELSVQGARSDLHSGGYGGVAPNPIHALCLLISRLKGEDGQINIEGIYDNPPEVTESEREFWRQSSGRFQKRLLEEMGVEQLVGENNFPPQERLGIRPTLEVHGIAGGFTGTGAKTVIPAKATAKLSLRLAAGIDPSQVFTLLERAVRDNMPAGYTFSLRNLHGGKGISITPGNKYLKAAIGALEKTYGKKPVFMREGGSIPVAELFDSILGVPVVLMGFGLPDDGAHGPNEKFSLAQFANGITTVADYLLRLAG